MPKPHRRDSLFLKEFLLNRVNIPRPDKRPINQIWTEFALTTSCHGVPQIERSRTRWRRVFWIVVLAICAIIFCIQFVFLMAKFLRFDKIVEIQSRNATIHKESHSSRSLIPTNNPMSLSVQKTDRHPSFPEPLREDKRSSVLHRSQDQRALSRIWCEFAQTTTLHGLGQVDRSRRKCKRLFWTGVILACLVSLIVQLSLLAERFLRFDKTVNMQIRFEQVAFPAVTICNLNAYKKSALMKQPTLRQQVEIHEKLIGVTSSRSTGSHSVRQKRSVDVYKILTTYCHCDSTSYCRRETDADRIISGALGFSTGDYFEGGITHRHVRCGCFFKENDEDRVFAPCYLLSQWTHRFCSELCHNSTTCHYRFSSRFESEDHPIHCMCRKASKICLFKPSQTLPESAVPQKVIEAYGLQNISGKAAMQQKGKENLMFATQRLSEDERAGMSYSIEEQIFQCSFAGLDCDFETDFERHLDPVFGSCYTFNGGEKSEVKQATRPGSLYGLRVLWYVNKTEYLSTSEAAGVKIAVHNQTEYPFPDTFGYSAPTGFLSSFAVKKQLVQKLAQPYGDCVQTDELDVSQNDDELMYGSRYSMEGCHRSCLQRKMIDECGCGDAKFLTSGNDTVCHPANATARACLKSVLKRIVTGKSDKCLCREPCQTHPAVKILGNPEEHFRQIVFTAAFSTANWPTPSAQRTICDPPTTDCIADYHDNAAFIEVYFEQVNYQKLVEHEAYGFVNLLADFGGYISLFLGISVITVVEIIVFIYELISAGIWKQDDKNPVFFFKLNEFRQPKKEESTDGNYPMYTDHVDMNVTLSIDD